MEVLELKTEKVIQGGEALAHLPDGRVCFVEGALKGELVHVRILKNTKDYAKGKVEAVLEPNPERVKPKCPYFDKCGGCALQYASFPLQIQMLKESTKDTFRRFTKQNLPEDFEIFYNKPFAYRNRARIQILKNGWGFLGKNSHEKIKIKNCPILTDRLNNFLNHFDFSKIQAKELDVFDNGKDKIAYYYKGMPQDLFSKQGFAFVETENKKISMDASVFFQSNLSMLPKLTSELKKNITGKNILIDLYSGVGFFSKILEDNFREIYAIERDKKCLFHAKKNLGKNAFCFAESAEIYLKNKIISEKATLIVDPPRTGLDASVISVFAESSLKRVIYVSCNPVTFSRDAKLFFEKGYVLSYCKGFAFYPQTPHLEILSVFEK